MTGRPALHAAKKRAVRRMSVASLGVALHASCPLPSKPTSHPLLSQAIELSALRQQLFEQQRAARDAEGALQGSALENEELQARVALLQETVATLEG